MGETRVSNEEKEETFSTIQSTTGIIDYESSYSDEQAALEAELAKLDAKTEVRQEGSTEDDAMSALGSPTRQFRSVRGLIGRDWGINHFGWQAGSAW